MEASVAIEEDFMEAALAKWKKGKNLSPSSFTPQPSSNISIRRMQRYSAPTVWNMMKSGRLFARRMSKLNCHFFLRIFIKRKFPKALGKRLKTVFGWRNAIVHFKEIPSLLDKNDDSYSKIESDFSKIKRLSLSRDYHLLKNALWNIVLEKDPDYDLASKASKTFFDFVKNQQKPKTRSKY
jgi:hypothetical protein